MKWVQVLTTGAYSYDVATVDVLGYTSAVFSVQACKSAHIFLAHVAHNHQAGGYEITIEEKADGLTTIR